MLKYYFNILKEFSHIKWCDLLDFIILLKLQVLIFIKFSLDNFDT